MKKHSLFLTETQFRETIQCHLKRIKVCLTPATMKVLDILRGHSLKALGVSYLLIDKIRSATKLSRSSVERALRKLDELGIIKREQYFRPKKGGDGANMYVFQLCQKLDEGAEMKGRGVDETPEIPRAEEDFSESKTSISLNPKKKDINTYVQKSRSLKNSSGIPHYIPKDFSKTVATCFSSSEMIKQLWTRVTQFKRKEGISNKGYLLDIALQAWEYTKGAYRKARKHWNEDRLFQCFYGTMREIVKAQSKNPTVVREAEEVIPTTDSELKEYLDRSIEEIRRSHGVENRYTMIDLLAKRVQKLYSALDFKQAANVVKCLGF